MGFHILMAVTDPEMRALFQARWAHRKHVAWASSLSEALAWAARGTFALAVVQVPASDATDDPARPWQALRGALTRGVIVLSATRSVHRVRAFHGLVRAWLTLPFYPARLEAEIFRARMIPGWADRGGFRFRLRSGAREVGLRLHARRSPGAWLKRLRVFQPDWTAPTGDPAAPEKGSA